MEKTTSKKKKSVSRSKNITISYLPTILDDGACFIGWLGMDDLVKSVYSSGISQILSGRLVFAIHNQNPESPLRQLIIVKNPERWEGDTTGKYTYSVSMITTGWTMYSPTYDYGMLETLIGADLEKYSLPSEVIQLYKDTIEKFKIIYNIEEIK